MPSFRRLARITLSLGICVVALYVVGVEEVLRSLLNIRPLHLAGALGMVLFDSVLRAANWNQLLNRFTPFPLGKAWLIYLSGAFYGSLIPSTVGTDAVRAIAISRRASLDIRASAASLVTLNLLGLGAAATIGLIAAGVLLAENRSPMVVGVFSFSAVISAGVGVVLFTPAGRWVIELLSRVVGVWSAAQRMLEPLLSALLVLPRGRRNQLILIATALLNQVIRITVPAVVAASLGLSVGWWALAAVTPLIAIVSMIPLSFLGIGIGQSAMIIFLAPFGVTGNDAFALSLTIASIYIGQSAAGGIVVLIESVLGSADTPQQADAGTA
jgi:hypothetical protein